MPGTLITIDDVLKNLDEKHVWETDTLPAPVVGRDGYRQAMQMYITAFPDLHFRIDQLLSSGDHVVSRYTASRNTQWGPDGYPTNEASGRDSWLHCGGGSKRQGRADLGLLGHRTPASATRLRRAPAGCAGSARGAEVSLRRSADVRDVLSAHFTSRDCLWLQGHRIRTDVCLAPRLARIIGAPWGRFSASPPRPPMLPRCMPSETSLRCEVYTASSRPSSMPPAAPDGRERDEFDLHAIRSAATDPWRGGGRAPAGARLAARLSPRAARARAALRPAPAGSGRAPARFRASSSPRVIALPPSASH